MIHVLATVTVFKISILSRCDAPSDLLKTYPVLPTQYIAKKQKPQFNQASNLPVNP